ncbi:hypothetical protein JVU11DRAFT_6396 [Chiua virens]|nr:hypothetical protein JVU11DRAFT_6396 [Chiua virens]
MDLLREQCNQCPPPSTSCSQPSCFIPEFTTECTDECLILACDDPDHGAQTCQVTKGGISCDGTCITAAACNDCSELNKILQCCTDYHSYIDTSPSTQWDSSVSQLLCDCSQDLRSIHSPGLLSQSIQAFISDSSISSSASSSPSLPPFSPQLHAPTPIILQPSSAPPFNCMWAGCNSIFNNLSDLVGHVNLQHLCAMDTQNHPPASSVQSKDATHVFPQPPLFCHWGDCGMSPSPSSIPSSSSATLDIATLDILASHLMQDHLGVNYPIPPQSTPQPSLSDTTDTIHPSPVPSNPPAHDCSGTHACKWNGCTESFSSCDDLTAHIASVHIGGGKAHYDCFWEGCNRHGTNGFSSKQKISRHLQSHTGHRPFQCQICNQNFSEAATLQQHMRRHTQERPYVCDFPGCGKAFAITGALTIHKRIHNGLRPFKCKFCDKAFSESSNLSKHLRTHTGARPYACTEEGCKKAFARPDQLARHTNVHRKKGPKDSS